MIQSCIQQIHACLIDTTKVASLAASQFRLAQHAWKRVLDRAEAHAHFTKSQALSDPQSRRATQPRNRNPSAEFAGVAVQVPRMLAASLAALGWTCNACAWQCLDVCNQIVGQTLSFEVRMPREVAQPGLERTLSFPGTEDLSKEEGFGKRVTGLGKRLQQGFQNTFRGVKLVEPHLSTPAASLESDGYSLVDLSNYDGLLAMQECAHAMDVPLTTRVLASQVDLRVLLPSKEAFVEVALQVAHMQAGLIQCARAFPRGIGLFCEGGREEGLDLGGVKEGMDIRGREEGIGIEEGKERIGIEERKEKKGSTQENKNSKQAKEHLTKQERTNNCLLQGSPPWTTEYSGVDSFRVATLDMQARVMKEAK